LGVVTILKVVPVTFLLLLLLLSVSFLFLLITDFKGIDGPTAVAAAQVSLIYGQILTHLKLANYSAFASFPD
jgi:hypothetical protein